MPLPEVATSSEPTTTSGRSGLRLHVGCGLSRHDGFLNCDLYPNPNVDLTFDCEQRWPFDDNSAADVYSSHTLEHLHDPKAFFREMWRVLQPNGSVLLRLPYGGHRAAWWDLEHVRPWYAETFAFLQPGYGQAIGNPQHTDWPCPFGIHLIQLRVSYRLARWLRYRPVAWALLRYAHFFDPEVEEIWAHLFALKTPDAVAYYQEQHPPHCIPTNYAAWEHHLLNQPPKPNGACVLINLHDGVTINGFIGKVLDEAKRRSSCNFEEPL